ncbi:phospholipase A2-like [Physella acuta]|uniref:phospholipase A2-like n=1 Tax=Physella acuta TaxID=109671 RepID=UPI0027DC56B8|nr:phospholipase A2-like [Physella acuta]
MGYGCWCGVGGSGSPVDATDSCCKTHDQCYDTLIASGCVPYFTGYDYTCKDRKCTCDSSTQSCADKTCKCDVDLANCAAKSPFDDSKKHYDKSNC